MKPLIQPIPLPFRVSSQVSNIGAEFVENRDAVLTVDTYWGGHASVPQYRRVRLDFKQSLALYASQQIGDDYEGLEDYDWSARPAAKGYEELMRAKDLNNRRWEATGVCEESNVYAISGSEWVRRSRQPINHYYVSGGDSYIEILAASFNWELLTNMSTE